MTLEEIKKMQEELAEYKRAEKWKADFWSGVRLNIILLTLFLIVWIIWILVGGP